MAGTDWRRQTQLPVTAVLAQMKIPAGVLAAMGPADCLEIESSAATCRVSFTIAGKVVAVGQLEERNQRLIATILWTGCETADTNFAQWQLKKKSLAASPQTSLDAQSTVAEEPQLRP